MSKFTILLFLIILSTNLFSQTVTTLVSGPSTFNDGLALDNFGNIYAARFYSSTVTKITPNGTTSIFAGGFKDPNGITFDNYENLLVPSANGGKISKVTPNGEVSTLVSIANPHALLVDSEDNLYVAHYPTNKISKIDTGGNVTTFWPGNGLQGPIGLVLDLEGNFYAGNFDNGKIFKKTPSGEITEIGDIPGWMGFMTLSGNNIYATAFQQNKIYKVPIDGSGQSIFAGTGSAGQSDGEVLSATFNGPNGIVATPTGDTLYVSDFESMSLRMITGVNGVTSIEDNNNLPDKFSLEQNFPNPFNPTTTIKYRIQSKGNSEKSNVKLIVYDALGSKIKELVNEQKSPGYYTKAFNGSNLSSGIYYYQLTVNNISTSKKMLLLQ